MYVLCRIEIVQRMLRMLSLAGAASTRQESVEGGGRRWQQLRRRGRVGVAVAVVDKDTDIAVAVLHEDGPRGGVRCVAHPVLVGEAEHARLDAAVPARREGGGEQAHRVEAAAVLERLPLPRPRVAAVLEDDAGACEAVGEGGNSSLGVTRGDKPSARGACLVSGVGGWWGVSASGDCRGVRCRIQSRGAGARPFAPPRPRPPTPRGRIQEVRERPPAAVHGAAPRLLLVGGGEGADRRPKSPPGRRLLLGRQADVGRRVRVEAGQPEVKPPPTALHHDARVGRCERRRHHELTAQRSRRDGLGGVGGNVDGRDAGAS